MNIARIHYFVRRGFPSTRTHHIQTAKMCDAFGTVGVQTLAVAPMTTPEAAGDLARDLALRKPIPIQPLTSSSIFVRWNPFRDPIIERGLRRFLENLNGVHGDTALYGRTSRKYPMGLVLDWGGWPRIFCEVHDAEMTDLWGARLARATGLVTISHALKEHLASRGIAPEKIHVAPDGVDLARYDETRGVGRTELRRRLGLPGDRPIVGYTGDLRTDRGGEVLLRALARLPRETLLLMVGGRESDRRALEGLARELGIDERIRWIGWVTHAGVAAYQAAADALVMTYTADMPTARWCSPLKMFEYMAAGGAIVWSDIPALHEVLQDGTDSLHFPPGDAEALADRLRGLLRDPAAAARMADAALHKVRAFSWDSRARGIVEFMSSVS